MGVNWKYKAVMCNFSENDQKMKMIVQEIKPQYYDSLRYPTINTPSHYIYINGIIFLPAKPINFMPVRAQNRFYMFGCVSDKKIDEKTLSQDRCFRPKRSSDLFTYRPQNSTFPNKQTYFFVSHNRFSHIDPAFVHPSPQKINRTHVTKNCNIKKL